MIRVTYSESELKDIVEGIIGKSFFIFCNDVILQVLDNLDLPARIMNQITIVLVPHDNKALGLAFKTLFIIKLKIQDTLEENEKTLIHETIHILKHTWSEEAVEDATNKIYKKNTSEILI